MSELNIAAMVLLGVAWLTLILGLRWQLKTKAVAALPGLATLAFAALAGVMAIANSGNAEDSFPEMLVSIIPELVAVVALVAIWAWQLDARRDIRHLAVVLWGTTAFGLIHIITDYVIIGRLRGTDPAQLWVPHCRHHHHQRDPDRDHDPTHAKDSRGC